MNTVGIFELEKGVVYESSSGDIFKRDDKNLYIKFIGEFQTTSIDDWKHTRFKKVKEKKKITVYRYWFYNNNDDLVGSIWTEDSWDKFSYNDGTKPFKTETKIIEGD